MIVTDELLTESANKAGDFKAFLLIVNAKAEPAPPKDFLPICKYLKLCKQGVSMGWEPCIMRCPYREE